MKTKRVFIGIFGRRNQGKSSLINAIAGQEIAIVSDVAGTTTDPVKKSIEVFGIGPVVFIDTAGIDDSGEVGEKRIKKTKEVVKTIDVAILLISDNIFGKEEENLIQELHSFDVPFVIVHNKADKQALTPELKKQLESYNCPVLEVSASKPSGIEALIQALVSIIPPTAYTQKSLVGDLIDKGSVVVLVMPQDAEAPEGRLILPQVQIIRDILDNNAIAVSLQPEQLSDFLEKQQPDIVITDSQVFDAVSKKVPLDVPLTSFSVILARAKGNFENYLEGTPFISKLKDGDKILILEACTHVSSCEDIGRHKIPNMLRTFTNKNLSFEIVSALSPLPENLEQFAMAIQCGACMVTEKQANNRIRQLLNKSIPVSNYGMTIAYVTGIFERITAMFK